MCLNLSCRGNFEGDSSEAHFICRCHSTQPGRDFRGATGDHAGEFRQRVHAARIETPPPSSPFGTSRKTPQFDASAQELAETDCGGCFSRLKQRRDGEPPPAENWTTKIERALHEGPLFLLPRRLASRWYSNPFVRDSHRESGVFSSVALLSPVESSNPPELVSSQPSYTPRGCGMQEKKNTEKSRPRAGQYTKQERR